MAVVCRRKDVLPSSVIYTEWEWTAPLWAVLTEESTRRYLSFENNVTVNLENDKWLIWPFQIMPQGFDRILLDAPCSGTGVIWKDQSVKTSRDSQDVQKRWQLFISLFKKNTYFPCRHTLQRELILSALDALDANSPTGGYLVYSTCSVLVSWDDVLKREWSGCFYEILIRWDNNDPGVSIIMRLKRQWSGCSSEIDDLLWNICMITIAGGRERGGGELRLAEETLQAGADRTRYRSGGIHQVRSCFNPDFKFS